MGQWTGPDIALEPPKQAPPPDPAEVVEVAGLLQGRIAGHTVDQVPKSIVNHSVWCWELNIFMLCHA